MARPSRYPLELRRRVVRMFAEVRGAYPNETAALQAVTEKLGIGSRETLRNWVKQNEVDTGQHPGRRRRSLPSSRRANEILKAAASFFAAELCATRRDVDREVVKGHFRRAVVAA
ncbi:hypothetical protein [Streptomyces sp. NPDC056921]|uniref:hypothetical protein n=1 Tax=Streptomyces sp. NPDC056921 TaxID=3345966 RepID=UPI00363855DF